MAIDTTTPRSRRALLTAAVGGAAAAAAAIVARAAPVEAANGDNVKVGQDNVGTKDTQVTKTGDGGVAFTGFGHNSLGLWGVSTRHMGVVGQSRDSIGLQCSSDFGHGLRVAKGRIQVDQVSGIAIIRRGARRVTVAPGVEINSRSFVLLTPLANIGSRSLWFTKHPVTNRIVIRMSSARRAPTKVAWLALERGY